MCDRYSANTLAPYAEEEGEIARSIVSHVVPQAQLAAPSLGAVCKIISRASFSNVSIFPLLETSISHISNIRTLEKEAPFFHVGGAALMIVSPGEVAGRKLRKKQRRTQSLIPPRLPLRFENSKHACSQVEYLAMPSIEWKEAEEGGERRAEKLPSSAASAAARLENKVIFLPLISSSAISLRRRRRLSLEKKKTFKG